MGVCLKNGTNSTISVDVRSIKVHQDTSRQQRHKRKRRRHYILLSYTFIISSPDKYKTSLFLLAGHIRTECKCTVGTDLHWKQEEATGQTDMPRVRIIGGTYASTFEAEAPVFGVLEQDVPGGFQDSEILPAHQHVPSINTCPVPQCGVRTARIDKHLKKGHKLSIEEMQVYCRITRARSSSKRKEIADRERVSSM